ncbi:DUF6053 domain-containing protein [Lysobacter enzymogenes]|uniref:DUF6053 domain-containing protein n=1 Tax=Lysobacter enzymogenes TaxID=69 RepID=UPI003D18937A
MGWPSGPMLLSRIAAIRAKGSGPEGPPTQARPGDRRGQICSSSRVNTPASPRSKASRQIR